MTNLQKQAIRSRSEQDRHWCELQDWYAGMDQGGLDELASMLNKVSAEGPAWQTRAASALALVALSELGLRRLEAESDE